VALDVERCRAELDELEAEMRQWSAPNPPGAGLWRHKLDALIGDILGPRYALAEKLSGVRWDSQVLLSQPKRTSDHESD
jgi:hypothetical protein